MIYVGIDDTDVADSRGTNQLARALVAELADDFRCVRIVRHQLLEDPRVPCTTKNGSASITLQPRGEFLIEELTSRLRQMVREDFIPGSDPGLCVTERVPSEVTEFGRRCQSEFIAQQEPREIAARHEIFLEGLGGTEDGVIGALAAVGLAVTGDDGRIVQLGEWPDDLSGLQPISLLLDRGLEIREYGVERTLADGHIDIGKRLRPNRRGGRDVLFVERVTQGQNETIKALKLR